MTGILAGLRVVEHSAFVAAPLGGMTLAQLGADVIRLDQAGGPPDRGRWPLAPDGPAEERSLFWAGLNKNKRSVHVDLTVPAGQELARRLITAPGADAGIFLTNLPVRGWLAYGKLRETRPDLIMVVITGDPDGTSQVDYTVQAASGWAEATGPAGPDPVNTLLPAWDAMCGLTAAVAILAAERHRRATGEGQLVTIALSDVALAMTGHLGRIAQAQLGEAAPRDGNYLYGAFGRDFATADGRRVMVVGLTGRQWRALVDATGTAAAMTTVAERTGHDLGTEAGRFAAREQIAAALAPWFAARDLATVAAGLSAAGACWGPYQTFGQLVTEDPRCSAGNPMFTLAEHPGVGRYLMPGSPARFGAGPQDPQPAARRAPRPGEHTREVLASLLGLAGPDLAALSAQGVIHSFHDHEQKGPNSVPKYT